MILRLKYIIKLLACSHTVWGLSFPEPSSADYFDHFGTWGEPRDSQSLPPL